MAKTEGEKKLLSYSNCDMFFFTILWNFKDLKWIDYSENTISQSESQTGLLSSRLSHSGYNEFGLVLWW